MFGKKGVKTKYSLRSSQLEYTRFPRAANEPPRATLCGVSSRPFLPQESRVFQLLGWVLILNELFYYSNSSIHNIYMILLFVNSKRCLVDWNGRRRLLRE